MRSRRDGSGERQDQGRPELRPWVAGGAAWVTSIPTRGGPSMIVRAARVEDAPAMARVIVDTGRSAHRDQMPEELLLLPRSSYEEAYAESERNWTRFLREIADGACPRDCAYVAE